MAFKQFVLDEHTITIYKRKASRSLRLSIAADGQVKVSIPRWAPYSVGLQFARSKQEWIRSQNRSVSKLRDGQPVGKAHHLRFIHSSNSRISSRVKGSEILITMPSGAEIEDVNVQKTAATACIRALRHQAESLLPQRLAALARQHDFEYGSISIKQLKSRWGSCDQHGNIVLNLFLMQLPWEAIDYVLLHELTHTKVLQHGPPFWQAMESVLPGAKQIRNVLKDYQPVLDSPLTQVVA